MFHRSFWPALPPRCVGHAGSARRMRAARRSPTPPDDERTPPRQATRSMSPGTAPPPRSMSRVASMPDDATSSGIRGRTGPGRRPAVPASGPGDATSSGSGAGRAPVDAPPSRPPGPAMRHRADQGQDGPRSTPRRPGLRARRCDIERIRGRTGPGRRPAVPASGPGDATSSGSGAGRAPVDAPPSRPPGPAMRHRAGIRG